MFGRQSYPFIKYCAKVMQMIIDEYCNNRNVKLSAKVELLWLKRYILQSYCCTLVAIMIFRCVLCAQNDLWFALSSVSFALSHILFSPNKILTQLSDILY